MKTRKINYIEPEEDILQQEVDWALQLSMNERFSAYCKHIIANYAMAGIDVLNLSVKRDIYYIEDEEYSE